MSEAGNEMAKLNVDESNHQIYKRTFSENLAHLVTRRVPPREEILDGLADLREKHGFSVVSEHPRYRGYFRFIRPGSFALEVSQDSQTLHIDVILIDLNGSSGVEVGQRRANLDDLIALKRSEPRRTGLHHAAPGQKEQLKVELRQIDSVLHDDLPELLSADDGMVRALFDEISSFGPERMGKVGASQIW